MEAEIKKLIHLIKENGDLLYIFFNYYFKSITF